MVRCIPEHPQFATASERQVWELLREQLRPDETLLANVRVSDESKDHEADLVVLSPGAGAVVLEVKGGQVWHDGNGWRQTRRGRECPIRPVDQARGTKYALRSYVESDPRWLQDALPRTRWGHLVVLPHVDVPDGFAAPDCPRWTIAGREDLGELAVRVRDVVHRQETGHRVLDTEDASLVTQILRGRGLPQRDVVALAQEREAAAQRLTEEQAVILGATQLLNRVEVRGGAGSGKTWLAVEQARRLTAAGQRVALLCYSRGLASHLRRVVAGHKRQHRPAYVGEFHSLGHQWGAAQDADGSEYWERALPAEMVSLARRLPEGQRFDAVVVDEAQDFADTWWPALLAALKDEETGGVYAFSDEGQRVFARYGRPPVPLVPLVLDHNMRNTRQIADAFNPLSPMRMRLLGEDGPAVRLVECPAEEALDQGDEEVDRLLERGWRPQDVALLTTGSRHPCQVERQQVSQEYYWESFWDADQVFYGHVLGFKGLERRAIVLVLNEPEPRERSRERLYVGLSRARDELVVCGDPQWVEQVGGADVLRRLRRG